MMPLATRRELPQRTLGNTEFEITESHTSNLNSYPSKFRLRVEAQSKASKKNWNSLAACVKLSQSWCVLGIGMIWITNLNDSTRN